MHPGPLRNPLLIETGDVTIDAFGWYDGTGALVSVEIDGKELDPGKVQGALYLLGHNDYTAWAAPLDSDKLAELSAEAFEDAAEAKAYHRERMDE
jgi:hypothetical protein